MRRRRVRLTLLYAFLSILLLSSPASRASQEPLDFPFTDLKGASHTLAEFRGSPVLLEFWASWCVPCRKGFPFLDQLQAQHEAGGLKVVAITLETDDEAVRSFVSGFQVRFLVGRDPSGRAAELYGVEAMPTAFLLDRDGKTVARFEGGTEEVHGQMEKTVSALMSGEPLPAPAAAGKKKGPSGNLKAWERGYLADPIMGLDGDPATRVQRDHIHSSKEGAAGDGGVAGGGCGCN
jgi:cytochrome c biogenesis protein CcmG/thiol:disulfide interchange protein DsbE